MAGKRKPTATGRNPVAQLVAELGGPTTVLRRFTVRVSPTTLGRWTRAGKVSDFAAGLELAEMGGGPAAEVLARARLLAGRSD